MPPKPRQLIFPSSSLTPFLEAQRKVDGKNAGYAGAIRRISWEIIFITLILNRVDEANNAFIPNKRGVLSFPVQVTRGAPNTSTPSP